MSLAVNRVSTVVAAQNTARAASVPRAGPTFFATQPVQRSVNHPAICSLGVQPKSLSGLLKSFRFLTTGISFDFILTSITNIVPMFSLLFFSQQL